MKTLKTSAKKTNVKKLSFGYNRHFALMLAVILLTASVGTYMLRRSYAVTNGPSLNDCLNGNGSLGIPRRPTLRIGAVNTRAEHGCTAAVQWFLDIRYAFGLVVDGLYGPRTALGVGRFQQIHHESQRIAVDGIVGPDTWRVIASRCTGSNSYICGTKVRY